MPKPFHTTVYQKTNLENSESDQLTRLTYQQGDEREGYPKHPVTMNFSIYPAVCNRRDQRRPTHHADIRSTVPEERA